MGITGSCYDHRPAAGVQMGTVVKVGFQGCKGPEIDADVRGI